MIFLMGKEKTNVRILAGPFNGARMILNPAHSKRKIFGAYEHILNPWLSKVLPQTEVLWDVGANDGYFTYGCAHSMGKHASRNQIIAFEPELDSQPDLLTPANWPEYSNSEFEFISKFVGGTCNSSTTTLDVEYVNHPSTHNKQALVKVDVEGAEVDVLAAASQLLKRPHQWVVEVHGDHLLAPVSKFFEEANRQIKVYPYKPHWLFGPEQRTLKISWITTED